MIVSAHDFSTPFKHPIKVAGSLLNERKGVYLRVEHHEGPVGIGEAAPLPGFSFETLKTIHVELEQFLNDEEFQSPSLQWALSCALLYQQDEAKRQVLLNGLITGPLSEDSIKHAQNMESSGYKVVKVKVHSTADFLWFERMVMETKLKFRLDFNQTLHLEDIISQLKRTPQDRIEYIEEPMPSVDDESTMIANLNKFYSQTNMKFALDESILQTSIERLYDLKGLEALVIKPMILGSMESIFDAIEFTRSYKCQAIISSSFETGYGIYNLTRLIYDEGLEQNHHGLDTLKYFDKNYPWIQTLGPRLISRAPNNNLSEYTTLFREEML